MDGHLVKPADRLQADPRTQRVARDTAARRYLKKKDPAQAQTCRQRLHAAQSDWTHHTQRTATLPGSATA